MAIDLDVHGNTKPLEAAVQAAINRIRRQPIKITVDDKGATQPLGNMKRAADEFSKSMEAANARILAFGASMAIINGVADAFKGMVRNLVEVEKSLADINVVMGLSTQNLDKFGDGLFKVAKETGAAFRVAADAATEYARQGLAVEETLKRTRDALVLTRLTGMDSAEAVKSLTAAMNTYGNQIKDTTQLVSKFAAVDVQFAVSAEDFAAAISRTGQAAKSAGVNIDELIGIVTSAQQQTARGGAVIGNALKTIFTKTGRTDTLNQLENLGIAVRDLEGNTIGAKRILTDLANTFDTLSEAQKAQITQTMGGLFHINILKAVLSDAAKQNGILANATQISANATDEAIQKNEQLRQTMSAMATETGLAVKQLSVQIGELMLAPGMEKILNAVKSIAEGAGDLLGDGESAGSKFANGFLKGLGNIITGPGLVVLSAVFIKLFGTAVKFTKESLTSLIGVTSEAQKQKAIQTTLVTLLGQNAALGKEMLRTDTTRTEKERVLLGLLQMQTAEANKLNAISKQLASTLYTRGYGPGLTQGRRRAYGHIPNFADPERAQAAKGGYAAGSIRTMNMPGEGSVIYNSAETVKNFAGFKQPAIMPPQSSKAGKNYQQAFGSIHGFDPYAAGGYIPNYAKAGTYNKDGKMVLFAASAQGAGSYAGKDRRNNIIYLNPASMKFSKTDDGKGGMVPVNVPYFTIGKNDAERTKNDPQIKNKIEGDLITQGQKTTNQLVNKIFKVKSIPSVIKSSDVAVAVGKVFEKILMSVQKGVAKESYDPDPPGNALLDIPRGGRDALWDLFGASPLGSLGAEAKIALGSGDNAAHLKSAAEKFYKIDSYQGIGGAKAMAFAPAGQVSQKNLASLGYTSELQEYINKKGKTDSRVPSTPRNRTFANWPKGRYSDLESLKNDFYSKARAYGHIPNFADPLSDAIGREKAAGVPVSQIRVGSHSALMSKGNPLGLGVTNTYDEPNGLRDVFGANGFVPNYAVGDFMGSIIGKKTSTFDFLDKEIKSLRKSINKYQKTIVNLEIESAKGKNVQSKLNDAHKKLESSQNQLSSAIDWREEELKKSNKQTRSGGLIGGYQAMSGKLSSFNQRFSNTAAGRALSGTGAQMGLMMGLPMAGGFLQDSIGGAAGAGIGGALSGAGTGASLGMMFGPLGTAIGATVGGLYGLVSGLSDAEEAAKDKAAQDRKAATQAFAQTGAQFLTGRIDPNKTLAQAGIGGEFYTKYQEQLGGKTMVEAFEMFSTKSANSRDKEAIYDRLSGQFGKIDARKIFGEKGIQRELLVKGLEGREGEIFRGKEMLQKFGIEKETATGAELMEVIKGAKGSKIEELFNAIKIELQGRLKSESEQSQAVILQLNAQRAILEAQQQARSIQLDIKSSYSLIDNSLSSQLKIMGNFATEQQKAQINYTKSINKAAEAYAAGAQGEEDKYREGMLGLTKNESISSALKTSLAKKQILSRQGPAGLIGDNLANTAEKMELTKELVNLSNEELYAELKKLELTDPQRQALEDFKNSKTKNIELLLKELQISGKIAENEFKINDAIARRKDILANMKFGSEMMGQVVGHEQAMRGLRSQVGAAERLTALGPGYQTAAAQEDFQMNEKRIQLEDKVKTIRENAQVQLSQEREKLADILMQNQQLADLKEKEKNLKQEGKKLTTDESNILQGLVASQEKRAQDLIKIENAQDNINEKAKEEISTAEKLLELEEKRLKAIRERQTGPGAFRNGISDGMAKVREQVETMDYELGEKIPGAFADGLANAMSEGLSGAKSIGDALRDSAINFLQMIQQAMMKKAAYSLVGAMGFSRGGNVRKYSNGGGVPAMVSNGEYIMGRDAVNKYGGAFMHSLNAGGNIPGFSIGGKMSDMLTRKKLIGKEKIYASGGVKPGLEGFQYKSGRAYQNKKMSGYFYSQSGNVGLAEDASALQGALQEKRRKEEEAVQKAKEKAARRNARVNQIIGIIGGALAAGAISHLASMGPLTGTAKAAGYGANTPGGVKMALDSSGLPVSTLPGADLAGSGFTNVTATRSWNPMSWGSPSTINPALGPFFWNQGGQGAMSSPTRPGSVGGWFLDPTNRYMGGPIRKYASGGYISGAPGIDQIPAMLSEGEYVIRASSARQLGRPMLDRINAGKFNDGGPIEKLADNSETSGSGGNTNNINISVNIEGGSVKGESKSSDRGSVDVAAGSQSQEGSLALADKIKQQVLSVIVEEQRPGGLLSD